MRPLRDIRGRLVELRAIEESKAEGPYLSWLQDGDVTRFLEARFAGYDVERLRNYIRAENERSDAVLFGIFRTADNSLIGTLKLSQIRPRHRNCELGLMIGEKSEWGKGIGAEAITLACRYAFETMGLHKVTAGCYSDNLASARAFLKAGFVQEGLLREDRQEGLLREDRMSGSKWVDTLILSRLNPADAATARQSETAAT